ncbi:Transmembrane protein 154, partial [Camelus dromedarius]
FLAETEQSGEMPQEVAVPDEETVSLSTFAMVTTESFTTNMNSTLNGELGNENLKVPIFEEDTPSVMEIEMEELDKWMNSMNRNADYECLPTLEEEKEPNQNHPRYF